jgi:hypothetical protein
LPDSRLKEAAVQIDLALRAVPVRRIIPHRVEVLDVDLDRPAAALRVDVSLIQILVVDALESESSALRSL